MILICDLGSAHLFAGLRDEYEALCSLSDPERTEEQTARLADLFVRLMTDFGHPYFKWGWRALTEEAMQVCSDRYQQQR